jgi:hypothetical protein
MAQRRRFSAEYEREAVAMLDVLGVSVSQIAADRQRASRARRDEVSDDPTMPPGVSHPTDVPMFAGLAQWIQWLGDSAAEWAGPGKYPITHKGSSTAC